MAAVSAGVAALGAGIGAIGSLGGTIINAVQQKENRDLAREENAKNRAFQKEMAQNNIKYAVQQAKEMGISPSLVIGEHTNALGGSNSSASGGSHIAELSGINSVVNALTEMNKLKTLEEINEDKLQTMKDIQDMRMGNSTTSKNEYYKRNKDAIENLINNNNNFDWQV